MVCLVLVSVPVLALLAMRLTSNQFVRETEQSLTHQAAIYARIYAARYAQQADAPAGRALDPAWAAHWQSALHPWQPSLNLRTAPVLGPLQGAADPDAGAPAQRQARPHPAHRAVAADLLPLARQARGATLAGALFLDHRGHSLGGGFAQGLAAEPEIAAALSGRVGAALRTRGDAYNRHPLTSISRDTWYRVFVAYPVILDAHVVGVVYLSRTPSNFAKFVMTERDAMARMAGVTLIAALLIGLLLRRLFLRPVRQLRAQSQAIADGAGAGADTDAGADAAALRHYGLRELADLGDSVMRMSKTLQDRSGQIAAYTDHVTHELKSPVTAILGAAELLAAPDIDPAARKKLLSNIAQEGQRMTALLAKLREMTRLRNAPTTGAGPLAEMLPQIPGLTVSIDPTSEEWLPMLPDHGRIVLYQLARNAIEHDATDLGIGFKSGRLTVTDNGTGIAEPDRTRVTDPFYTTRRAEGGTGLGLAIVNAVLQNYGAEVRFRPTTQGASAVMDLGARAP